MNCGERIRKLRESKKMSINFLAREVGVPVETLDSWESGTSLPEPGKLLVLAAILGTSAAYLDKGTESAQKEDANRAFRRSGLYYTVAIILYFAGFSMGVFPKAIHVFGTPLLYYGTSPLAISLLAGTLIAVVIGITARKKR